jgi:hypothetical protein
MRQVYLLVDVQLAGLSVCVLYIKPVFFLGILYVVIDYEPAAVFVIGNCTTYHSSQSGRVCYSVMEYICVFLPAITTSDSFIPMYSTSVWLVPLEVAVPLYVVLP